MKSLDELIKDVERSLVINISLALKYKRMDKKRARDLAWEFMAGEPYKSKGELFRKLNQMSNEYKEVRKIYVKYAFEYEDEENIKILENMRYFMKNNDLENAVRVARGKLPRNNMLGGGE